MAQALKTALAWKLAIFKAVNGWFTVLAMTFLAGANNLHINPDRLAIITLILACVVAGNKFIDGFLDQTVQNIKRSQDPLGLGSHTEFLTKDENKTT